MDDPVRLGQMLLQAVAYERARCYPQAEPLVRRLLAADPENPEALHLMSTLAVVRGDLALAADCITRATAQRPSSGAIHRAATEIHRRSGNYDAALAAGARALACDPTDSVAHAMTASVHLGRLELDAAMESAQRALALNPDCAEAHFELATCHMLRGDYASGWDGLEWGFKLLNGPKLPPTGRPRWQGEEIPDGELMLVADQGYGDAVQFARFLPWVAQRCPHLAVAADAPLVGIIRQVLPGVRIQERWDPDRPFAAWSPLSSLPRLYGANLENLPLPPYLRADPTRAAIWAARLSGVCPAAKRRVGIVWAGNATHHNNFNRSMRLEQLAPLAARDDLVLISLQKGSAEAEVADYGGAAPLLDLGRAIADFDDTMAIIAALDLVIAVDTAVAHLAGAMGRPVWTMLPYLPDWRWLLERSDSPWYPSMRLFRQPAPKQWGLVIENIVEALAQLQ